MSDTVLLEAVCRCGSTHDVWAEEHETGGFSVDATDMKCPVCERQCIRLETKETLA